MRCPTCDGFGNLFAAFHPIALTCPTCKGKCLIEMSVEKYNQWLKKGKILRGVRLKQNLSLRDAAVTYKTDASNISKMERGLIKPVNYFIKK
jgi:hypothetical protein